MKTMTLSVLALTSFALLTGCGSTIPAGSKGIYRSHFSGTRDAVYDDGFKWHWPWNGVITYDVRWNTRAEKLNILSSDDLHMMVEVALQLRPTPSGVHELHTDTGPNYYIRVVQQPFRAISLEVLSSYMYSDISKKTAEIQNLILLELQEALQGKHLDFDSVEIRHVEYPMAVLEATNEKLATQQLAEQKQHEKTIAAEEAQIKIIEAQGQKEAQEIIHSTLTPLYLQFQAIEVQRQLAENPNSVFYFMPLGRDGLPIIVETSPPEKPKETTRQGNDLSMKK